MTTTNLMGLDFLSWLLVLCRVAEWDSGPITQSRGNDFRCEDEADFRCGACAVKPSDDADVTSSSVFANRRSSNPETEANRSTTTRPRSLFTRPVSVCTLLS